MLTRYKEEEEEKNYYQGASVCSIDIYKKEEKKNKPENEKKKNCDIYRKSNKQIFFYKSIQQFCLSRELLTVGFVCEFSYAFLPLDDE